MKAFAAVPALPEHLVHPLLGPLFWIVFRGILDVVLLYCSSLFLLLSFISFITYRASAAFVTYTVALVQRKTDI